MEDRRFALRLLMVMAGIVIVAIGAEFWYELSKIADASGAGMTMSEIFFDKDKIRPAAMKAAQSYTTGLLTMNLTFIGLAIPLTANMYTPKLIELFVRDRINLTVLCTFAGLSVHSMAVTVFEKQAGLLSLWIALGGAIIGWTLILPYYFYVLSFLNPVTIIARVQATLLQELEDTAKRKYPPRVAQKRVNQKILNLGSVLIRAVERADRDVAIDAVRSLATILRRIHQLKPQFDPVFLNVSDEIMVGSSRSALKIINGGKIWVEQKVLNQMLLAYVAALGKAPDAVSSIANEVKDAADFQAGKTGSREVLDLEIRMMNTFVREAIKKKDVNAAFDILYQYMSLMRKLLDDRPDLGPELAVHLRYYANFSKQQGVPFVYELAAQDLAFLVEHAYEQKVPTARELLTHQLGFEGGATNASILKPRLRMGGYFLEKGLVDEERLVGQSFSAAPAKLVEQALAELEACKTFAFWEVTDRGINFDFMDDKRRVSVREFGSRLTPAATATAAAKTA